MLNKCVINIYENVLLLYELFNYVLKLFRDVMGYGWL